jgi:hypothetical protein
MDLTELELIRYNQFKLVRELPVRGEGFRPTLTFCSIQIKPSFLLVMRMTGTFGKRVPMSPQLPLHPDLRYLKKQARRLYKTCQCGESDALARIRTAHPRAPEVGDLSLADAQLVVAREYEFESWAKLKSHVKQSTTTGVLRIAWVTNADLAQGESHYVHYIRRFAEEASAGFIPALERMVRHLPRSQGLDVGSLQGESFSPEEGQEVYAREHAV